VVLATGMAYTFAVTVMGICSMSLRQMVTPEHLLGRVTAAFWTAQNSASPLGAALLTAVVGAYGALTRTVRDAALALDVIAGYKSGALVPIQGPAEGFLPYVDREPGRLRVGRFTVAPSGVLVDSECVRAVDVATELLLSAGHQVEEIAPPVSAEFGQKFVKLWALNAAGLPVPEDKVELLRPITRWLRAQGTTMSGADALGLLATIQAGARGAIERSGRASCSTSTSTVSGGPGSTRTRSSGTVTCWPTGRPMRTSTPTRSDSGAMASCGCPSSHWNTSSEPADSPDSRRVPYRM
jgi:Amidase